MAPSSLKALLSWSSLSLSSFHSSSSSSSSSASSVALPSVPELAKPSHHDARSSPESPDSFDTPGKYFHEVGGTLALSHYDVRFFKGQVSYAGHRVVLRNLVRSYLTTMRAAGVETWIAHGTLLGWWWNARTMPWDYDADVQVANATMAWLAQHMNGTRHTHLLGTGHDGDDEDLDDLGSGGGAGPRPRTYLLDISPHHADLFDRGGSNIIDARWIDVHNGMFIDITVLRERDPDRPGVWTCKNRHRYATHDLWPLRVTHFEGVEARVPYEFERILVDEYGPKSLQSEQFHKHRWDREIQEWVKMSDDEVKRVRAMAVQRKTKDLKKQGRLT
ncbi:Protein MNN4 [Escovopsis weberi]|uniref:Protein MNN4 n=1 Tax=Escovopsis weberi TaxID=150374 RepID=A0A0M9VSV1_ESCWE|nr:Protein MNN4 [Escovopsis weberi]